MSKKILLRSATALAALLLVFAELGCSRSHAGESAALPPPPQVPVLAAHPQIEPDVLTFSGRIEALHRAELRPRVGSVIASIHFQEGAAVAAGELLFTLDDRPFRTRVARATAELQRAQAASALAKLELVRTRRLHASAAVAVEELERRTTEVATTAATVAAAQAELASAELDLEFTRIRAPFSGRVGRAEQTPGNLVLADQSVLTQLVSTDSMRVRFAVDETTVQRLLRTGISASTVQVSLTGAAETYAGAIDFVDPKVDPTTGTVDVRAILPAAADSTLLDGRFARVALGLPSHRDAVLVPETAIGSEQGSRFVLVAGPDNALWQRPVELGSRFADQRAVLSGVSVGESVVVAGLQFLRPGMTITPVASSSSLP